LLVASAAAPTAEVVVASPDRAIRFAVTDEKGHLVYRVTFKGQPVIEASRLGIAVDGVDLGQGATLGKAETYKTEERYAWRGVHSQALDHSQGARISVAHRAIPTPFTVDIRVFDDAVAYRFVVPGNGLRVPDATSTFRLPAGSTVWCQGTRDHYEGVYVRKSSKDVAAGEWANPPLTARLPRGIGYASITEAALRDYATPAGKSSLSRCEPGVASWRDSPTEWR
jgi:alpha-glucosidase